MDNGQFEGIIKMIEKGRDGDGYHIEVTMRCGERISGAWGYVTARKDTIYVKEVLSGPSTIKDDPLPLYIDIKAIERVRGPL